VSQKSAGRVIIVKKKKKSHGGGHHGGSWKVAYADIVTAMMAFFLVMWILGMDENLKKSIEGYFSNPVGFKKGYSAGRSPLSSGSSPGTVQTTPLRLVSRMQQVDNFNKAKSSIEGKLNDSGLGQIAASIEITMSQSGLRIEMAEGSDGDSFFPVGSSEMKPVMHRILEIIGAQLAPMGNGVIIEGHTDSRPYTGNYSNWELSADRANAARRVLEASGVSPSRVREVRGLADRDARVDADSYDPRNRRITIVLPFSESATDGGIAPTGSSLVPPGPTLPSVTAKAGSS
jgi:chemotaxis protein MotB